VITACQLHHAKGITMNVRALRFLFSVLFFAGFYHQAAAQEWSRFRGPNGTGESECKTIPAKWTDKDVQWKVEVPGIGHSSPVLWADKVFLLSGKPDDATRFCLCYSAKDGKQLWQKSFQSKVHKLHKFSSYGSSTPAADAERVYFGWSTPEETTLIAFDHDGNQKWRKNLGRWVSQHGFGTSPVVYKDIVILNNAQDDDKPESGEAPGKSFMMAFDAKTGDERWRTPLQAKVCSYSVPMMRELPGGKAEIVCTNSGNGVFALDPTNGKMNWSVPDCLPLRTVSSPVLAGGLIFGTCGSGAMSANVVAAVRPGEKAEIAYELKNGNTFKAPYVPSMVKRDDMLFLFHEQGYATCIDAATGKIHWHQRTGVPMMGSPVRIADKIYCIGEDGVCSVFAADKEYKLLAQNPLGEESRSTPAVANGKLFLRTYSHLICVSRPDAT
jgi:outer membrane protein assembly factor BamB